MEYQSVVRDILHYLHRIKVMLWASDYVAAGNELYELQQRYQALLDSARKRESEIFRRKRDFDEKRSPTIEQNLKQQNHKGRSLEYEMDIARTEAISDRYESDASTDAELDFAFLALSRNIERYQEQVSEALSRPKQNDQQPEALNPGSTSIYRAYEEQIGPGIASYRVYRLNGPLLMGTTQLIGEIGNRLNCEPVLVDKGDTELPCLIRFFAQNALVEIALLDSERFTVTITHGQGVFPVEIFASVVDTLQKFMDRSI